MNKSTWPVLVVAFALIGGCAGFLQRIAKMQSLGKPGVKLVAVPSLDEDGKVVQTNSVFVPENVLDYQSQTFPVSTEELHYLPRDTVYGKRRYYETNRAAMQLNIVLMGADRTSIHKPQYCLVGQGWHIDRTEMDRIPMARPHAYDLPVMKLTTSKKLSIPDQPGRLVDARALYVYWFVADGEITATHGERMWWMARDMVRSGVLQRWAYASVLAICEPGQEDATYEQMKRFIIAAVPEFQLAAGPKKSSLQSTSTAAN
ncbi:MAG: exosortase-associated EpsI family protein [Verrucomicrobia bacterium]|nr:exosortase-associated EpsI family protein [Verrucomicrobiota bacterium]